MMEKSVLSCMIGKFPLVKDGALMMIIFYGIAIHAILSYIAAILQMDLITGCSVLMVVALYGARWD